MRTVLTLIGYKHIVVVSVHYMILDPRNGMGVCSVGPSMFYMRASWLTSDYNNLKPLKHCNGNFNLVPLNYQR